MRCFSCSCSTVVMRSRYLAASSNCCCSAARLHALPQRARKVGLAAFQKHAHVAHGFGVSLRRGQPGDARPQASLDVVLQAGTRVVAREIDLAGRNQKVPVDEIDDAVGEVRRKIRTVIDRTVAPQPARHVDARKALGRRELDVGIALVVAQQNVIARLLLLDQVVFERQRLALVGHDDVLDIDGLAQQAAGLGVFGGAVEKVGAHPGPQVLGLADVNDLAFGVLVEIHAGIGRQSANFLVQVHCGYGATVLIVTVSPASGTRRGEQG